VQQRASRPDVERLRREAHERAVARPRRPFLGTVVDEQHGALPLRRYVPDVRTPGSGVVYLHGGYGLLGDLELQDGYCRRLAGTLGLVVVSVDYRLAPEASLDDSVADALAAIGLLAAGGHTRLFLCGDSAGGAVAIVAASRTDLPLAGLLLTNPNVDLTMRAFDDERPGGPDRELSEYAFRAWARVTELSEAPRLDRDAARLPRTVVVVGSLDALVPEGRALVERVGAGSRFVELPGAEHGFVGTDRADEALAAFRELTQE